MKQLVKGLCRWLGFDIVRFHGKSVRTRTLDLFNTATGRYYLPRDAHGDAIARAIKANQVFDREIVDVASSYIKPGTAVLDVGANFGQMSILFARLVGDQGKVYAFDADDFVFEILKKNIEANGCLKHVVPIFGAVHEVPGLTLFFPVQDFIRFNTYGAYGIDYNATSGRTVSSMTIDSLEITRPVSFMKFDVQGSDLLAMRGARNTILRHKMPIIFEYEYLLEKSSKFSFQDYVDFVREIDYRFAKVVNGSNYLILPR